MNFGLMDLAQCEFWSSHRQADGWTDAYAYEPTMHMHKYVNLFCQCNQT